MLDQQQACQGDPFGFHDLVEVAGPEFGVGPEKALHGLLVHLGLDLLHLDGLTSHLHLARDHALLDEERNRLDPVVQLEDPVGVLLLAVLDVPAHPRRAVDVVPALAQQVFQVLFLAGVHLAEGIGIGQVDRLSRMQPLQLQHVGRRFFFAGVQVLAESGREREEAVGQGRL